MRAVVLYHPKSDHGGIVEDYAHDFKRFKGRQLELLSLETRDGWSMASLYDVTSYPAILALADDGKVLKLWQGMPLPLMDEVQSYLPVFDRDMAKAELLSV